MSVKVTGKDLSSGEEESTTIAFGGNTKISGIVKDVNDVPLVGATIGIVGSTKTTQTDGTGAFSLTGIPSGDQALYIDGTTIVVQTNDRKYSKTNIAVNIGLGQQNVIENPIYLAPLMLDGTQTPVTANSPTTVTSPNAPGVSLQIPPNATTFPTGGSTGNINIGTVPSDKSTVPVPESAVPTNVVTLEPSGLSFNQRVELTLPNDNELPAGVEMLILSMNSKKGQWEVDGLAVVSEDGNRVVTKPGFGISHFSLVYAVPIKPVIMEMSDKKVAGIDASKGSLATGFNLPSYKSLGSDIRPSFVYKSSWANPSALVSNWFDIPSGTVTATYENNQQQNYLHTIKQTYCRGPLNTLCETDYQRYYINLKRQTNITSTSWYQPESIKSQFFVSSLTSDSAVITGDTSVGTDPSGIQQLPGASIKIGSTSKIYEYKGLPNQSVISYALDLKDPADGKFLASGVYPTLARYQIRLKNLTLTTTQYTDTTKVNGRVTNVKISQESQFKERKGRDILPSDIVSSIIVQNKTKSPYGRGWQATGASKILNPSSSRIVMEESTGEISTYGLNNPISTLFDGTGKNIDLAMAVDITRWPQAYIVRSTTSLQTDILKVDLSSNSNSFTNIATVPQSSGSLGSQGYYACPSNFSGNFTSYYYPFTVKAQVAGVVAAPNGSVYLANSREHSLWNATGSSSTRLAGSFDNVENVLGGVFNSSPATMNNLCLGNFGAACGTAQPVATLSCATAQEPICPPKTPCKAWNPPYPAPSLGDIGYGDYRGDGQVGRVQSNPGSISMNRPGSVVIDPNGNVVIADTGNNRIRQINLSTNTIVTRAGNGSNADFGDNGLAVNAGIFHPLALAFDINGTLYFTTESGYIKRIDSNGYISTVAGKPLASGGLLADEAPALQMFFNKPMGLVVDSQNNFIYVGDTGNNRVVRIDLNTGVASNVAGNGQCVAGNIGDLDAAINASLCAPTQVGLDSNQNLIVVDSGHQKIRRINFSASNSGPLAFTPTNKDQSVLIKNSDSTWIRKFRTGDQAQYDSSGKIAAYLFKDGKTQQYAYDSQGNLTSFTDSVGQQLLYSYTSGKLASVRDPAGRVSTFSYNGDLLTEITFPDGNSKQFEYNENGLLTRELDERGYGTKYGFNQWRKLQTITAPDNSVVTLNDSDSASVANNYSNGVLGTLSGTGFEDNQFRSTIQDSNNHKTELAADLNGYVTTIKNALGEITTIERDLYGNPTSILLADGSQTTLTYDPVSLDLLTKKDESSGLQETFIFDTRGNLLRSENALGQATTNSYDATTGRLLSRTNPGGIKTTFAYNNLGLLDSQTVFPQNGQSVSRHFQYDNKGNVIKTYFDDGKEVNFTYDLAGNVVTASIATGGVTQTKQYFYDAFNRLIKVQFPNGDATEYAYLPTGQLSQIKAPNGKTTSFEYNFRGQLTKKTASDGRVFTFGYDGNGNVIQSTDPNGNNKVYTYDALNRLKQIQLPDDLIHYSYNVKGSIIEQSNNVSNLSLVRDTRDRIVQASLEGTGSLSDYPEVPLTYSYNDNDQVTSMQSSVLSVSYGFDSANRLAQLGSSVGDSYQFFFDSANRLAQTNRPGSRTNYTYNPSGTLSSMIHSQSGVTTSFVQLGYDEKMRITSRQAGTGTTNMTYDSNNQLLTMAIPLQPIEQFAYDNLGNRSSDSGGTYTYDQIQDKLAEDWQFSYTYDNNGNLILRTSKIIGKMSYRYNYNSKNQLIEVLAYQNLVSSPIKQVFYSYDVLGRRIQKKIIDNSTNPAIIKVRRYLYDGNSIIAELDVSNGILATYTHSMLAEDDVLSMHVTSAGVTAGLATTSGSFYYLKDHLGSTTEIANNQGQIIQKYEYAAFGKVTAIKNGSGTVISTPIVNSSYAFTGRELDSETGLYYYRARYFDADSGRFIQKDPDAGKLVDPNTVVNSYAYVRNSPMMYTDPSGEFFDFAGTLLTYGTIGERLHLNWDKFASIAFGAFVGGVWNNQMGGGLGALAAINFSGKFSQDEISFSNKLATVVALSGLAAVAGGMGAGAGANSFFGTTYSFAGMNSLIVSFGAAGIQTALTKGDALNNFLDFSAVGLAGSAIFSPISNAIKFAPDSISPVALKLGAQIFANGLVPAYSLYSTATDPLKGVLPRE